MIAVSREVEEEFDSDFSDFEEKEFLRISRLTESPLSAYARYLARLDMKNPRHADDLRMNYPVTRLVKADFLYARQTIANRNIMVNGCLSYDTKVSVFTDDGKIERICLGDNLFKRIKVFGFDTVKRVFDIENATVISVGEKECYKLSFLDGSDIVCTYDHRFYRKYKEDFTETKCEDLSVGDELLCGESRDVYKFSQKYAGLTKFLKIIKKQKIGIIPVLDVVMDECHVYMLDNGLITHNSAGTCKSFAGMSLADWLDQNGFWTHNKGNYDLPNLFFDVAEAMAFAKSNKFRAGSAIMIDEDPKRMGQSAISVNAAITNFERTVARYSEINFVWIYVAETSHQINTRFYTRGVYFDPVPLAKYVGLGVLQPTVAAANGYALLGKCSVDVPKQRILDAYDKKKKEYVAKMKVSGGFGLQRNIVETYSEQLKMVAKDKRFIAICNSDFSNGKKNGLKVSYISRELGIPKCDAELLMSLVDLDVAD